MMYCLSLQTNDLKKAHKNCASYQLAEIRLDLNNFSEQEIIELVKLKTDLIFTYRKNEKSNDRERLKLLQFAIENGASYIDIDINNSESFILSIMEFLQMYKKTKLIISYHNYLHVPTNEVLFSILIKAQKYGASIIKLACYSHGDRDNKRMLSFNSSFKNILAFNMGKKGSRTRYECLEYGAPFSYVCLANEKTAPGQMTRNEMQQLLENKNISS